MVLLVGCFRTVQKNAVARDLAGGLVNKVNHLDKCLVFFLRRWKAARPRPFLLWLLRLGQVIRGRLDGILIVPAGLRLLRGGGGEVFCARER